MRYTVRLLMLIFILLGSQLYLAACGGGSPEEETSDSKPKNGTYRVALEANLDSRTSSVRSVFDPENVESYNFATTINLVPSDSHKMKIYFRKYPHDIPDTWRVYVTIDNMLLSASFDLYFHVDGTINPLMPTTMRISAADSKVEADMEIDFKLMYQYGAPTEFLQLLENGPS